MSTPEIRILLEKLNGYCQTKLQDSVAACVSMGNYELTWEQAFLTFLDDTDNDIANILHHFEIDISRVKRALTREIEGFKKGNNAKPVFSPLFVNLLGNAWSCASLQYQCDEIRSGILLYVFTDEMKRIIADYTDELRKIDNEKLKTNLFEIVKNSSESKAPGKQEANQDESKTLQKYCKNLTSEVREGKIDPILGRDDEIFQVIDILCRRRKNNPILVGDAGVGKTAIMEGLAQQIVAGDVPITLRNVDLWELDLGLLQAGASVKGEFEKRLKSVIDMAKKSAGRIMLFIDEAHTLIGAGGAAGMGDAANLLKPALARGELRTCAATTWLEYRKYFEKDPALTRRFQLVRVDEPDEQKACSMLRGIAKSYESHHGVHVSEDGIKTAVAFSKRFIAGRQLPDKAVDVLDTACTRVKMSRTTTPPVIEKTKKMLADANRALEKLNRDRACGFRIDENEIMYFENLKSEHVKEIEKLTEKWQREQEYVEQIITIQNENAEIDKNAELNLPEKHENSLLYKKIDEFNSFAGDFPMVYSHVSGEVCARVIGDWTGIPVGSIIKDEAKTLLELESRLTQRVIGQQMAVSEICSAIRCAKTGMTNPDAPLGVFLCTGPSGVGKTECAMALAEILFGGEKFSTIINMSEYQEKHTVSQLKGSPPGYVGYGEGGILTEAVRQKPYSIVILDEVEKAHRDVLNMFYQVFDKGIMRDGEGRDINFRNTIIMMTSNLGADTIIQAQSQAHRIAGTKSLLDVIRPELTDHFGAALLARCTVIPFVSLSTEDLSSIILLKMKKIQERLRNNHSISCECTQEVISAIAQRCSVVETGARNIDAIINTDLLPVISDHLLSNVRNDESCNDTRIVLDVDELGEFKIQFSNDTIFC